MHNSYRGANRRVAQAAIPNTDVPGLALIARRKLKLGANGSGLNPEPGKAHLRGLMAVGDGRLG